MNRVISKRIISLSTIFVFSYYFVISYASAAAPVQLFFIPENADVAAGDIIKSDIWLDTQGNSINAVDITVSYDQAVEVLSAEKNDSILNLWVEEPSFSDTTRRAKFIGGRVGGFAGRGVIGQLYWRSAGAGGKAVLDFDRASAVLLNDGLGTPAELELRQSGYNILAKGEGLLNLSSASHSDENMWYNQPFVRLGWPTTEGAVYSYLITRDPLQTPDDTIEEPVGNIKLSDLTDGVYYFRIKEKNPGGEWSQVVSRQIKIDKTPPDEFEVKISRSPELFNNKYFLSFSATDAASGLAYYEIKEGDGEPETVARAPYVLRQQKRNVPITVRALDKAGNDRTVVIAPLPLWERLFGSLSINFRLFAGLILVAVMALFIIWRRR
ncbi:hypothetical protein A3I40_00860 [Candidatus Uhrbacteria bacterium RIFCSPLOWO2_02_FULL_48_12]|uniref:Cohesin domain-containing protein n=1 Tax=Candidatus Uhrbacteria bacterium RIFCSPLOWO2_02_FULL_48_12 TaxID=1802407 RepID=A0A1F7VAA6_9BACT|nr:MAG: hypothetical protein A3I40_00860 [Candidatus Uhrbacteria bacterium RIFCSPLOWO2_02_FULL_48_12]